VSGTEARSRGRAMSLLVLPGKTDYAEAGRQAGKLVAFEHVTRGGQHRRDAGVRQRDRRRDARTKRSAHEASRVA